MNRSLRRELEAIRRALAGRPPRPPDPPDPPDPPGPSVTEVLSRWDPIRMAGVLAVAHRTGELDRFCDAHDDSSRVDNPRVQKLWALDWGGRKMPWDRCANATCRIKLDRFDPASCRQPDPIPEPELFEDDDGRDWPARRCDKCDRRRSAKSDQDDHVWMRSVLESDAPWNLCTKCGRELEPCEPITRGGSEHY